MSRCPLCESPARLVHEFKHSRLVVGEHQLFEGYCVLVYKDHVREPHELPPAIQQEMFRELMISAEAIQKAFAPWKLNYSCYGNQVPHIHWHIFPRYESDPLHKAPPWNQSEKFAQHATSKEKAREVASACKSFYQTPKEAAHDRRYPS